MVDTRDILNPCSPVRCNNLHTIDCCNNLIYCHDLDETLAMIGVSDLVVIRYGRHTIIAHRSRIGETREILNTLIKGEEEHDATK